MISAFRIIEDDRLPRMAHVADEIKPLWPHPLAALFEYLFTGRVTPVMYVRGKKIEEPCGWIIGGNMLIRSEWARHLVFRDPYSIINVDVC